MFIPGIGSLQVYENEMCEAIIDLTKELTVGIKQKSPSLDKERESIAMKNKNVCIEITLFIFSFRNVS